MKVLSWSIYITKYIAVWSVALQMPKTFHIMFSYYIAMKRFNFEAFHIAIWYNFISSEN